MCGIAGLLDPGWSGTAQELSDLARAMARPLAHRGPDDEGTWCDGEVGVGFGHRRLAVIDLSPAGHQPMVSADGRWVAAYNGECYNAAELRAALPDRGRGLKGRCDTEVVVEAVAAWGLRPTLERLDAMFALALWDRRDRVLHLTRDRLGEKPLYYSVMGGVVLFGSELRALLAHPRFSREIDRRALALLLRLNYIPAPLTIFSGARKLAAATLVSLRPGQRGWPEPEVWWDFPAAARTAMAARPPGGDDQGALDQLEAVLAEAVSRRLVADVPIGSFLSGGIDSSLVTALAQAGSRGPVRTFTVGFAGQGHDEADHAEAVARHLGTAHTRIDLTADDALNLVPHLGRHYDEPFADPSQLPTLLMCREASRHVTVALSGDGGDEAFGGYRRYTAGAVLSRRVLPLPRRLRGAAAGALDAVPGAVWDGIGRGAATAAARRGRAGSWHPRPQTGPPAGGRVVSPGLHEPGLGLGRRRNGCRGGSSLAVERSATPLWPGGNAGRGDDGLGHALDAARRDAGQGRPGQHGLRPRGAAAPGRPQGGGGGLESAAVTANPRGRGQAGLAPPP